MAIVNGQIITPADVNGIWSTALATLRARTNDNTPYKQFVETFQFNGVTSLTAQYLSSYIYSPRTDVVVRAIRVYCMSATAGIVATVSIPAQIVEDNIIVGGNIKSTITATATSNASVADMSLSGGLVTTLPNNEMTVFLAGDNIDIIVSTNSLTAADITVSLLLETTMVG